MVFAAAFLTVLAAVLPEPETLQDDKELLGEKKVTMKTAWFTKGPSWSSEQVRLAEDGEDVAVVAVKGKYSQVTARKDNLSAWIVSSALIPPEKFSRSAADEKEGQKLAAQGLEGQKGLNPETEKEFKSAGGASREKAYADLDALMARPGYKAERPTLVAKLREFRREGKLGEFSPVK
jgi:uncharacterized protein YgiM (DUF1202 family)